MSNIIQPSRRLFLGAAATVLAAPAIVRAASLMPIKVARPAEIPYWLGIDMAGHQADATLFYAYYLESLKPAYSPLVEMLMREACKPHKAYLAEALMVRSK